jgi:hypothetical protein
MQPDMSQRVKIGQRQEASFNVNSSIEGTFGLRLPKLRQTGR